MSVYALAAELAAFAVDKLQRYTSIAPRELERIEREIEEEFLRRLKARQPVAR